MFPEKATKNKEMGLNKKHPILDSVHRTIKSEAEAVYSLLDLVDDNFIGVVECLYLSKGRVVFTGIGKSAIIAQKIVATFNSTGTSALFMHAADAVHGDLGMISSDDVVVCLSQSGETPEIKVLIPWVKRNGNPLVGMTGNPNSYLGTHADYFIPTTVGKEAGPNNLAPTSSTTVQMVVGDAIAVALMEMRGFSGKDFSDFHPGGNLGKRLYLRVGELYQTNKKPSVKKDEGLREIIISMTSGMLGITVVVDDKGLPIGVITDGDLRRMLLDGLSSSGTLAKDIMSPNPKTASKDFLAALALEKMREFSITQMIIVDDEGRYEGIVHLHDLIREGIV